MCTTWTMTKLVRWRIRDWATCFLPCSFPLGVVSDQEQDICRSSSTQMRTGTTVCNPMGDITSHENNRYSQEMRETVQGSTQCSGSGAEKPTDDSCWPKFRDEDYIVFCFKENGVIHVVKDGKSDEAHSSGQRSVNRKLMYGENAEDVSQSSHEIMLDEDVKDIYPTNEGDTIISDTKGKEKRIIYLDNKLCSEGMNEQNYVEAKKECKTASASASVESSSSTPSSESSTSSFAFPVLRWEWMGSPAKMPKPEGLHYRKHKQRNIHLQCCRF